MKVYARIPEVLSYYKSGGSYAESVFNTDLPTLPTTVNSTLYESQDCKYTLFCTSLPFPCYYHTVEFLPEAMKRVCVEESPCDSVLVQSKSFRSHPLLANSVYVDSVV